MVEKWQKMSNEPYALDWRRVERWTFRLPDGSVHDYDININAPVAVILALTPDMRVVIARQYRPGLLQVLNELPAGIVDAGESPLQAAERELLEETGYAGELEYVGQSYRDAYSTIILHTFIARNCQAVQAAANQVDEFIEVALMTLTEFRQHLRSGQLTDIGPAYLALDYLGIL